MMTENVHSILLGRVRVLHSVVFYCIVLRNWCYYSLHAVCCANLEVWDFSHGLQLLFKKSPHWILHIYTDMHAHHTHWPEYSKTDASHQTVIWLNKNLLFQWNWDPTFTMSNSGLTAEKISHWWHLKHHTAEKFILHKRSHQTGGNFLL